VSPQADLRGKRSPIQPAVDENGGLDWGAFATVEFERSVPGFDRARYKAERLREELRDALIMVRIITRRLPKAKYGEDGHRLLPGILLQEQVVSVVR
jgi:hypothetical protein